MFRKSNLQFFFLKPPGTNFSLLLSTGWIPLLPPRAYSYTIISIALSLSLSLSLFSLLSFSVEEEERERGEPKGRGTNLIAKI